MTVPALLAAFAAVAALAAARERRHRDMGAAAGIAAALSPAGLALLPALLGTAIARRRLGGAAAAFATGLAATYLLVGGGEAGLDLSIWRWAAAAGAPELRGPLLALAVGGAAWLAASCAARPPSAGEIDRAALLAALVLPALVPLGIEAMLPAVLLLAQGVRPTLSPVAVAANDDPLPPRRAVPI